MHKREDELRFYCQGIPCPGERLPMFLMFVRGLGGGCRCDTNCPKGGRVLFADKLTLILFS